MSSSRTRGRYARRPGQVEQLGVQPAGSRLPGEESQKQTEWSAEVSAPHHARLETTFGFDMNNENETSISTKTSRCASGAAS